MSPSLFPSIVPEPRIVSGPRNSLILDYPLPRGLVLLRAGPRYSLFLVFPLPRGPVSLRAGQRYSLFLDFPLPRWPVSLRAGPRYSLFLDYPLPRKRKKAEAGQRIFGILSFPWSMPSSLLYSTLFSASTGSMRFSVRSVMALTIRENPSASAAEMT